MVLTTLGLRRAGSPYSPDRVEASRGQHSWVALSLVASIGCIALDEFNINAGFFSLKFSLVCFALAVLLYASVRPSVIYSRELVLGLILVSLLTSLFLTLVGVSHMMVQPDEDSFLYTKPLNLVMLLAWTIMLIRVLTLRELLCGYALLTVLMMIKNVYITYLFYAGRADELFWLPSGLPRFALNRGGMVPNQAGAVWMVIFIFYVAAISFGFVKRVRLTCWLLVLVVICGTLSGSRSFLIGIAASLCVLISRRHGIAGILGSVLLGTISFILFSMWQPERVLDDSLYSRFDFWDNSLKNIAANPLFGSGFGSDAHPHNTAIQLLSEVGVVGLLLQIAFLVTAFSWRGRFLWVAFVQVFLPYVFYLLVDIGFLQWQTWLLVASGAILGRCAVLSGSLGTVSSPSRVLPGRNGEQSHVPP